MTRLRSFTIIVLVLAFSSLPALAQYPDINPGDPAEEPYEKAICQSVSFSLQSIALHARAVTSELNAERVSAPLQVAWAQVKTDVQLAYYQLQVACSLHYGFVSAKNRYAEASGKYFRLEQARR